MRSSSARAFARIEIAEVLAHHHLAAERQRDGALELPAEREHARRGRPGEPERQRREAARATEDHRAPRPDAHHRVVDRPHDRPIVDEEQVGDVAEPRERLVVVDADRLLGEVAARADERARRGLGEQSACSGVDGSIDAEPRVAGRDRGRDRRTAGRRRPPAADQQDRRRRTRERRASSATGRRRRAARVAATGEHQREGLLRRAACARAAARRRPRWSRRRGAGSRRGPSAPRSAARRAPAPPRRARRRPPRAADPSRRRRRSTGPQAGHAIGSAWKRRSPGRRTRGAQAAHGGKRRIVVRARS